jgi:uncharacterized cupredoxin-like copper-binding protein
MKHIQRAAVLAASIILATAAAHAAGNHAGGHGHGEASAIGQPGVAAKATRTVKVDMTDNMRFTPERIEVKQGETVRFLVSNSGKIKHELVLGTEEELKAHYEAMKKNPEMEHADPNQITLAPGKTGEIVWQFTKAGLVDFACLQPGHYDAGMKGAVKVAAGNEGDAALNDPTLSAGEVRKVDKEGRKLTIKHGPLANLDMPAMTMVFQVKDEAMLDRFQPGDKVRFQAKKVDGKFTVTRIEAAP